MKKYSYIIRTSLIVSLLIMYSSNTTLADEPNWPQFRGPGGLGIATDNKTYPIKLDTSQNLLWKIEVPKGHSSPCIWGDRIFITARSEESLETICIDRRNGQIRWRKSVEPKAMEKISSGNSHASPTPVCDGKQVYVYFGSFGLIAYDIDGNEVWQKSLPLPDIKYGSAASPLLARDMVILNCDSENGAYLIAVSRDTGRTIWRQGRQVEKPGWSTPVLWKHGKEEELVVFGSYKLISYNLNDGQKRWWLHNLTMHPASTPVYAGGILYLTAAVAFTGDPANPIGLPGFDELLEDFDSNRDHRLIKAEIPENLSWIPRLGPQFTGVKQNFSGVDVDKDGAVSKEEWEKIVEYARKIQPKKLDALVAIRSGGKDDVSESHVHWRANEGIGQVVSPLVYRNRVYLIKHGGIVTCYDAISGKKIYGDKIGPGTYYYASPVAADNKIYFCSMNGVVIVVQAGDKFKILAQNKIGDRIYATPALVDGKIYLRTDKNMYAFFTKDDSDQTPLDIVAKVENDQAKTLHDAATDGDIESVKSLISSGADVNAPNNWGWTPLYAAAAVGHGDVVNLLIAKGANVDVDTSGKLGATPLLVAINNDHRDIVRLLIENGADFRVAGKTGVTPLHKSAEQGNSDIAALLIDKGADVNAKDKWIWTPLHYACWKNHKDTAEFLLAKGADINAREGEDKTPLAVAEEEGHSEIVELLRKHGAKE